MANDIVPFAELTKALAEKFGVTPQEFVDTVKMQCFPNGACTNGQLMMLCSFAQRYGLNPLAKQCYAFVSGGRMSIGVPVDGWIKIACDHPEYDGQEMEYEQDSAGNIVSVTSKTYVKGRSRPTVYKALLKEWKRNTDVWNSMPMHQLYVKAHNQGVRFAFGIAASDPDDLERIAAAQGAVETTVRVVRDEPKQIEQKSEPVATETPPPSEPITPEVAVDEQPQEDVPAQPTDRRAHLDSLISKKVTPVRLQLLLGQRGAESVEELTDEQVESLINLLEKK